ncbi:hypothetical protein GCM10023107_05290 [Actinoplanes octamycinicus]|nr:hypothetical protein Aoc01nite_06900 [Actinoplanes octamycinicus]
MRSGPASPHAGPDRFPSGTEAGPSLPTPFRYDRKALAIVAASAPARLTQALFHHCPCESQLSRSPASWFPPDGLCPSRGSLL